MLPEIASWNFFPTKFQTWTSLKLKSLHKKRWVTSVTSKFYPINFEKKSPPSPWVDFFVGHMVNFQPTTKSHQAAGGGIRDVGEAKDSVISLVIQGFTN